MTHVAATQTYGNVVEFATQTEDVQAKEAVETCIASVQTEAMGQPDAQMGELAAVKNGECCLVVPLFAVVSLDVFRS